MSTACPGLLNKVPWLSTQGPNDGPGPLRITSTVCPEPLNRVVRAVQNRYGSRVQFAQGRRTGSFGWLHEVMMTFQDHHSSPGHNLDENIEVHERSRSKLYSWSGVVLASALCSPCASRRLKGPPELRLYWNSGSEQRKIRELRRTSFRYVSR